MPAAAFPFGQTDGRYGQTGTAISPSSPHQVSRTVLQLLPTSHTPTPPCAPPGGNAPDLASIGTNQQHRHPPRPAPARQRERVLQLSQPCPASSQPPLRNSFLMKPFTFQILLSLARQAWSRSKTERSSFGTHRATPDYFLNFNSCFSDS